MAQIKKRGETYTIMVSLGYDNTGKQIRKYMTYKPDKSFTLKQIEKEVQRQAVLFEDKCKKGLYLDNNITFSEFTEKWFNDYAEKQLKAKTIRGYRILSKRVNAAIGHIKLDKLQPHHLVMFYNNLKEGGVREDVKYKTTVDFKTLLRELKITQAALSQKSSISEFSIRTMIQGNNIAYNTAKKISESLNIELKNLFKPVENETLSDNTIHHYHTFISSVLSTAVIWQVILSNPCERVKPPKVGKHEAKYLDEENLDKLIEIIDNLPKKDEQHKVMIKVLLFTGMRKGELCGLKFDDIDFKNRIIKVKRNLLYLPEKGVFEDTPKTETSIREIPVSDTIIQLLNQHKLLHLQKQTEIGDKWHETDYIFTSWNGLPLHPDTISAWFRKFVKKHDLPNISIHSLRHTAATMLIMNGVPLKVVSSLFGHVNEITTGRIYSHVLKSVNEMAVAVMEDVMSGNKNKKR